ncbi:MAG TPA: hypothetical protein VLA76_01630 [Candidatus Angelobacter sp.]|nr:hypothetical protein [Candidatus Angelobacter sp.]
MNDRRSTTDRLGGVEGADDGALGTAPPPEGAPPGAQVSDAEHLVPGAGFDAHLPDEAKPWFTSLAAESDQAGVANDPPDAQEPLYPADDHEALEDEPAR